MLLDITPQTHPTSNGYSQGTRPQIFSTAGRSKVVFLLHVLLSLCFASIVFGSFVFTVVPTKCDSDVILSLQSLSKTIMCTLHLSIRESIDHLCINPILWIGLIHK